MRTSSFGMSTTSAATPSSTSWGGGGGGHQKDYTLLTDYTGEGETSLYKKREVQLCYIDTIYTCIYNYNTFEQIIQPSFTFLT